MFIFAELDITIPGLYFYHQELTRRNYVEGWGNLSLPIGDYECLLVRTEIEATDSIYVNLLDLGFVIPRPMATEYKWLANGEGTPVLHINESGGFISQIQYRDEALVIPNNISGLNEISLNVSPNPAQSTLNISTNNSTIVDCFIYDSFGTLILEKNELNDEKLELDISQIAKGNYIIVLNTREGIVNQKFTKI